MTEAVVMAAGEGRRLRPVTERWPKPILPIDGRPVIASLLRQLAAAGCRHITVVTGHLAEQIERLLGEGSAFGLEIAYARQPRPDGSADAVARALAAGATPPLVVTTADTIFGAGDIGRFAASQAPAVAVRRKPRRGAPVDVVDGRVVRIAAAGGPLIHASLWSLTPDLVPYLDGLPGPPFELADAYQRAIDDGVGVSAVEVAPTRDLTDPLDLVKENFVYLSESR